MREFEANHWPDVLQSDDYLHGCSSLLTKVYDFLHMFIRHDGTTVLNDFYKFR